MQKVQEVMKAGFCGAALVRYGRVLRGEVDPPGQ